MKKESFYNEEEYPSISQKQLMWKNIEQKLPHRKNTSVHFHWKSFWIGNVAAILLLFAGIGVNSTLNEFDNNITSEEQVYETLTKATHQLQKLTPLLIQQANEQNQMSIESTADAIVEIDRLIEEMKIDIQFNGSSPSKENSLKRLYATKLDFYKEILLNQQEQS